MRIDIASTGMGRNPHAHLLGKLLRAAAVLDFVQSHAGLPFEYSTTCSSYMP